MPDNDRRKAQRDAFQTTMTLNKELKKIKNELSVFPAGFNEPIVFGLRVPYRFVQYVLHLLRRKNMPDYDRRKAQRDAFRTTMTPNKEQNENKKNELSVFPAGINVSIVFGLRVPYRFVQYVLHVIQVNVKEL
ncbi:hypothetical protein CEXT_379271 [Caerostris extrusa]|uniref:Uncharacterized protein n=1 Tax=Caerostris extrusa TaxID=172846 RepID=A0AAV4PUP6_CAEEX|nr:hypothetical protein CEXT_379271 [Caerostris extrusa]